MSIKMKQMTLIAFSLSLQSAFAQNASSAQNGMLPSLTKTYTSPNGVVETCQSIPKWIGSFAKENTFDEKDLKTEAELCAINFYEKGICPKLNSTNPGVLISDFKAPMTKQKLEANFCTEGNPNLDVIAKFKNSITCSYTPSGISSYYLSRILGGAGRVPVAVLRTMDKNQHLEVANRALSKLANQQSSIIRKSWSSFVSAHQSRPSTLFNSQGQVYGFLADNVKGEFIYTEVSGVGDYDSRYSRFIKQAPYLRVASPAGINEILKGNRDPRVAIPILIQMQDVSDMVLLDTLTSQDDRIGNIHYKFRWYLFQDGKKEEFKSKAEKVTARNRGQMNYNVGIVQAVVPAKELAEMTSKGAFLVKEMVLKDNDCGVNVSNRTNNMRQIDAIENVRHMSYKTYSKFIKFAQAVQKDPTQAKNFFTKSLLFREQDFEGQRISFLSNLKRAYDVLTTQCESGALKFDLDIDDFLTGAAPEAKKCR